MKLKPKSSVHNKRALLYRRYTDLESSRNTNGLYKTQDNKYWQFDTESSSFVISNNYNGVTPIQITTNSTRLKYVDKIFYYDGTQWQVIDGDMPTTFTSASVTITNDSFTTITLPFDWKYGANMSGNPTFVNNFDKDITVGQFYIPFKKWTNDSSNLNTKTSSPSTTNISVGSQVSIQLASTQQHTSFNSDNVAKINVKAKNSGETATGTIGLKLTYGTQNQLKFPSTQKYQLNKYYYVGNFDYMLKGGVDTEDVQYIKGAITPTRTIDIRWFEDDMKIDHDDLVVLDDRLWVVTSVSWDIKRMPKPYRVYFGTLTSIL